jgi:serine protease Do
MAVDGMTQMKMLFVLLGFLSSFATAAVADTSMPSEQKLQIPQTTEQIQLSFAPLVARAAPAVVNIYTQKLVTRRVNPLFDDPFFSRFFGGMIPPGGSQRGIQNSLGSGVIVRPDGLVVTSNHVIDDADEIRVVLSDKREFPANVVVADKRTDLAVLRIVEKMEQPLPFLEMKDSDEALVGDLVLAIGNPFGVGQTVTSGIISALARTDVGVSDYSFFIQTDAAINPGNSGGALVAMDGRLLGINTAIFSKTGGSLGIGFAIPSTMVKTVLLAEENGGKLQRPWLGANAQTVTAELAPSLGLSRPQGAVVTKVFSKSPAARADIRAGDVILAIDGKIINDNQAMRFRIATVPIGKDIPIRLIRRSKELTVNVAMEPPPFSPLPDVTLLGGAQPLSGASIANLSPGLAEKIGFDGDPDGVVIFELSPRSAAAQIGLQVGDIVRAVNNIAVSDAKTLAAIMRKPAKSWAISLQRGDQVINTVIQR